MVVFWYGLGFGGYGMCVVVVGVFVGVDGGWIVGRYYFVGGFEVDFLKRFGRLYGSYCCGLWCVQCVLEFGVQCVVVVFGGQWCVDWV